MGTILAASALLALAACGGGGTTTATNNAVSNDVYVPDDLGNDLLLNGSDLNAAGAVPAGNAATTNAAANSL